MNQYKILDTFNLREHNRVLTRTYIKHGYSDQLILCGKIANSWDTPCQPESPYSDKM